MFDPLLQNIPDEGFSTARDAKWYNDHNFTGPLMDRLSSIRLCDDSGALIDLHLLLLNFLLDLFMLHYHIVCGGTSIINGFLLIEHVGDKEVAILGIIFACMLLVKVLQQAFREGHILVIQKINFLCVAADEIERRSEQGRVKFNGSGEFVANEQLIGFVQELSAEP